MNLRPIQDKIIIRFEDQEQQTSGGIFIATAKKDDIVKAEVLAVGPGSYDDKGNFVNVELNVGARILINSNAGQKFKHDEQEYVSILENEIVAVLS